jgi:glycosyltransferase involved in cell wall biosynthesis
MPVGIDTEFFKPDESIRRIPGSILFLGRISPVKNILLYIKAMEKIKNEGIKFTSTIAGASLPRDKKYESLLKEEMMQIDFKGDVRFVGPVNQEGALRLYREHEVYVNLTPSGSMDKTIFEAMACECIPVVANKDLNSTIPEVLIVEKTDEVSVAASIGAAFGRKSNFRGYVEMNHSLKKLISGIMELA